MNTAGYIVIGGDRPMTLGSGEYNDRLYFGSTATLFDVRRRAQKAINATVADRPTFEQEFGKLRIVRCETE